MDPRPYYQRPLPKPQNPIWFNFNRIDLTIQHLPPYPKPDPSGVLPDSRPLANSLFDNRAAAAVSCSVGDPMSVRIKPRTGSLTEPEALLESKVFDVAPSISILTAKCLAAMAYADYFPNALHIERLRPMVSEAIMNAGPGWCGSFGPGVTGAFSLEVSEGNYDMTQMFLLPLAYSYYDELTPEARERLITLVLARGRINRPNEDDTFTSGGAPNDWSRAGHVSPAGLHVDIPETENHVLMIATARYLTNQLLYQRDRDLSHDNRRNGDPGDSRPNCTDQVLGLLRNQLRNDFAEYNAKNYQEETRHALLNLCSYAYDAEVRLGARMVLDYISAHIAVSSNDLRRMVPFRRRNEGLNVRQNPDAPGFMDISLLDAHGADPMPAHFALLAGNTRAYHMPNTRVWPDDSTGARPWSWAITPNFASELTLGALSDYRLPPSIHDLFVNDLHRRFFQRLHRHRLLEEPGQQRNCDNMEIYAGSPSYLITAGGKPAIWVIPGQHGKGFQAQNLGVAVPTSFMPTGLSAGADVSPNDAKELIQFLRFSDDPEDDISGGDHGGTENYGVAPDFACGFAFHLPDWTGVPKDRDGLFFVNRQSHADERAGFFLAINKFRDFALMEAFDTWLQPEVSFEQFQEHVTRDNPSIQFKSGQETVYTTFFGNRIHFVIWNALDHDNHIFGSKILSIEYAAGNPADTLAEAGNGTDPSQFLSGTILKSPRDAVVEIHNPFLHTKITLDWSDPSHLVRTSESGEVEEAGNGHEVWVDFDWKGPFEGDFFRPFNTIAAAADAVADGGVIKIMPGTASETRLIHNNKRIRLVAPIGGVNIGGR
jgi:hypothetical protein